MYVRVLYVWACMHEWAHVCLFWNCVSMDLTDLISAADCCLSCLRTFRWICGSLSNSFVDDLFMTSMASACSSTRFLSSTAWRRLFHSSFHNRKTTPHTIHVTRSTAKQTGPIIRRINWKGWGISSRRANPKVVSKIPSRKKITITTKRRSFARRSRVRGSLLLRRCLVELQADRRSVEVWRLSSLDAVEWTQSRSIE